MKPMPLLDQMQAAKDNGTKKFVVLIDPDKMRLRNMERTVERAIDAGVDYFFVGGSLIVNNMLDECLTSIKQQCDIPLILFPGNSFQLSYRADAVLFMALISGRNPELLIGNHVIAAPYIKLSPLQALPTGYMLVDGGTQTTVSYMSNTSPLPANKPDIAVCTALAGQFLGMKLMFLDGGSGAKNPVPTEMIEAVSSAIDVPLIVGGGIRTPERALQNVQAGADIIVVGDAIERDPELVKEMAAAVHSHRAAPVGE